MPNLRLMLREKYMAPVAAATLLALGATACGASRPTCLSEFNVSQEFPGDPHAVESNQNTWRQGVEIFTHLPKGSEEVLIGFTDPDGFWHDEWLKGRAGQRIKMKIGAISVQFKTQIKAAKGSPICQQKPDSVFMSVTSYNQINDATVPNPQGFHTESPH